MIKQDEFARLVRRAMAGLYDYAQLHKSRLADWIIPRADQTQRGIALQRLLLDTIQQAQPPPSLSPSSPRRRVYQALRLRYVEGLGLSEVAQRLNVSQRQLRRDLRKGLNAVTTILWARYLQLQARQPSTVSTAEVGEAGSTLSPLEAELMRLGELAPGNGVALEEILQGVLDTLSDATIQKGITIRTFFEDELPLKNTMRVSMHPVILRHALLSLLIEALERASKEGITLTVRQEMPSTVVNIRLRIPGGRPTDWEREDARLSVGHRLLEMQGGQLTIQAQEEDWFSIRLLLPAMRSATVLVVDDNPDLVSLFRRYLSGIFRVIGVSDEVQALEIAHQVHPQAITVDLMMPSRDGWSILQALKNDPLTRDIPVIVCSVLKEEDLARVLGAAGFLVKPVTQQALLEALRPYAGDALPAHPE